MTELHNCNDAFKSSGILVLNEWRVMHFEEVIGGLTLVLLLGVNGRTEKDHEDILYVRTINRQRF